jgi:AraC family transcriptional regulator
LNSTADSYLARFHQVFDYIDAHLAEELSVERLSGVAAFSKYHFHRQFAALFGLGIYKYVQLMRLKRAAYQLAFRHDSQVTDIALASGYEVPEAFSRAFKRSIGQSPSEFRRQPQWQAWHAIYQPYDELRIKHMSQSFTEANVTIVDCKETQVATLEHRGDPRLIGNSIRKFIEWRKQNKLHPRVSATFNICYDNPAETPPGDYRMDLCAATEGPIAANVFGVVQKTGHPAVDAPCCGMSVPTPSSRKRPCIYIRNGCRRVANRCAIFLSTYNASVSFLTCPNTKQ